MISIEKLASICSKYEGDDYYFDQAIKEKKLQNARANFPIPVDGKVIVLINSTVLGSNKNGVAIGEKGIYWSNDWATKTRDNYLSWEQFKDVEIKKEKNTIKIGPGNNIGLSGCSFRDKLTLLFQEIQNELKNNDTAEDTNQVEENNNSEATSKQDIMDTLKELKELLDMEIITKEEFQSKKEELLDRM